MQNGSFIRSFSSIISLLKGLLTSLTSYKASHLATILFYRLPLNPLFYLHKRSTQTQEGYALHVNWEKPTLNQQVNYVN